MAQCKISTCPKMDFYADLSIFSHWTVWYITLWMPLVIADSCPAAHGGWNVVLGGEEDGWDGKVLWFNWGKRSDIRADCAEWQRRRHLFKMSSFHVFSTVAKIIVGEKQAKPALVMHQVTTHRVMISYKETKKRVQIYFFWMESRPQFASNSWRWPFYKRLDIKMNDICPLPKSPTMHLQLLGFRNALKKQNRH